MIRNDIRALKAYQTPASEGLIKLDAMENPFPLPHALRKALADRLAEVSIHRYPDPTYADLRRKIAAHCKWDPEGILLGNGSDEIIQMILLAADAGPCIVVEPGFVMYSLIAKWMKRPVATVPLKNDFSLDSDTFLRIASREKARLAFLACPNNPTGTLWPKEVISDIAKGFRGLLLIDEAYFAYSGRTHTELIAENVAIIRTFSKIGWAGLRLGYLLGMPSLIREINKVRLPYNVNSLSCAAAGFLLEHHALFQRQADEIRAMRDALARKLAEIPGVVVYPSHANFLLIRVPDGEKTFKALLDRGILVKAFPQANDGLRDCLRVTIGLPKENERFLRSLKEILS